MTVAHDIPAGSGPARPLRSLPTGNLAVVTVSGILTAMVTPFDPDGAVAEEQAEDLIRHLLANGSDGLVLTGTTGEASTLTDEEQVAFWELGLEVCRDASPEATVVAGAGSNDTRHAVELTERAAEVGVDAVLSVAPYYNRPNRRGIVAHFEAVAGATDLPIVLYNIPGRTGVNMPPDLLAELAGLETVVAVKQSNADECRPIDGLDLLAGNDDLLAPVLDMGGAGGILMASHFVGAEMRRMVDEPGERAAIDAGLGGIYAAVGCAPGCVSIKAALDLLGHDVGGVRLPMVEASPEERALVREALEAHGLLERAQPA